MADQDGQAAREICDDCPVCREEADAGGYEANPRDFPGDMVELMRISNVIEMPWERDLSMNHCKMGPQGNWHLKRHVEGWMDRLAWEAKLLNVLNYCLPLYVVVDIRFPDGSRRDDHNYYKVICDAVAKGLGIDDKDLRISTGKVTVDKENPGFTITITDEETG